MDGETKIAQIIRGMDRDDLGAFAAGIADKLEAAYFVQLDDPEQHMTEEHVENALVKWANDELRGI